MKTEPKVTSRNKDNTVRTVSILYTPDDGKFRKIVIFCHGFPGSNRLSELALILTGQGIALLEVGYQGDKAMGCGGKFSFIKSTHDIGAACLWVEQVYDNIEKQILGFSAGGFYALNFAYEHPELVDSLVLLNPVVTWLIFFDERIMHDLWKEAGELLSLQAPDAYKKESDELRTKYDPCVFADRLAVQVTLLQSQNDEVLKPALARYFIKFIHDGKFILIKRAGHGLRGDEPELIEALTR